jgi:tRNA-2-methylthio-N6-dimethylallyladenosine synthase
MTRKLYIQTFGCQMNLHDSEKIVSLLGQSGYCNTDDIYEADLIIINTCSIREKADQKAYSQFGRLRRLRQERPNIVIGIGGCLAQQNGTSILRDYPFVDLVFGTHQIHKIPALVQRMENRRAPIVETSFRQSVNSLNIVPVPQNGEISAYVTIMQGCNNYCSFCVVPYLRGREESRALQSIIDEIKLLADSGVREVTLLGQNVNSYGKTLDNGDSFTKLLHEIEKIGGIERIRFTTSHPKDLSEDLMDCFTGVSKLCEHIHLPVQSGSDSILAMMNRCYTSGEYLEKIDRIRSICPRICITSDIIVGFPGETDNDFQSTLDLMERVKFDGTFSFKYSERPGTAAAMLDHKVADYVKQERLQILQSLQDRHSLERNTQMISHNEDVLLEGFAKNSKADVMGRTRTNKIVNIRGSSDLIGKGVSVVITEAYQHSLRGNLL